MDKQLEVSLHQIRDLLKQKSLDFEKILPPFENAKCFLISQRINVKSLILSLQILEDLYVKYKGVERSSGPDVSKNTLNTVFAFQSLLLTSVQNSDEVKRGMCDKGIAATVSVICSSAAKAADKLDVRISLPLWKYISGLLKLYKNELRCSNFLTGMKTQLASDDFEFTQNDSMNKLLKNVTISLQHYFNQCISGCKDAISVPSACETSATTSLKMLNLLTRISTFCAQEFSMELLAASMTSDSRSYLYTWLEWILGLMYGGGPYALGSGIPPSLIQELSGSLFLAPDIALGHLITLPPLIDKGLDCSIVARSVSNTDLNPSVKCRIYGIMLTNLVRKSHCYRRWVNDDFNIYDELFKTCMNLDMKTVSGNSTDTNLHPYSGEFYTTLLQQICASICGLPFSCFAHLESALLSALLCEHAFTSFLATDVWCFLARYGTGDLCWHYVTLLANSIQKILQSSLANSNANLTQMPNAMKMDSLGNLLSRLIIFLVPKQQVSFFKQFPLNHLPVDVSSPEAVTSLLWQYVPVQMNRLQKSCRTLVEQQINQRLLETHQLLSKVSLSSDPSIIYIIVQVAITVHLTDCLPSASRQAHSKMISDHLVFLLRYQHSIQASSLPLSSLVLASLQEPVVTLFRYLANWIPDLTPTASVQNKLLLNPVVDELFENLVHLCCLTSGCSKPLDQAIVLQAWLIWLDPVCNSKGLERIPKWLIELRKAVQEMNPDDLPSALSTHLCGLLQRKLGSLVVCENASSPDSKSIDLDKCLTNLSSATEQLRIIWSPHVVNVEQISRARQILQDLSHCINQSD